MNFIDLADPAEYEKVLTQQVGWVMDNTLEKQFERLLRKHHLLPG